MPTLKLPPIVASSMGFSAVSTHHMILILLPHLMLRVFAYLSIYYHVKRLYFVNYCIFLYFSLTPTRFN